MTHLTGSARARYVRDMFARIARRYDLMNRLMTAGQDVRWRRMALELVRLPAEGRLLDLGTGTGDIARATAGQTPGATVVAADFTLEMMRVGRQRGVSTGIRWVGADALQLPFPSAAFDAVTSGFLMRNVVDVRAAFFEQRRVLRPGGRVVCLDTTPPPDSLLRRAIDFHLHKVIPALGQLVTRNGDAYTYLPDSTQGFLDAESLAERMRAVGFRQVGYRRLMFGAVALHWGTK